MSVPKNQHIIPRCYLKQFVDPRTPPGQEPYVWIFERDQRRGRKKAPKNILAETDFYTLKGNYTIEKTLAQIESEYSSIFERKISKKRPLSPEEHILFCAFVAAMLQRTLKQKENIEGFIDQVVENVTKLENAHGMSPKTSEEWRANKEHAHKLSVMAMIPEITKILFQMNAAFLCSDGRASFIASDAPAFLFNSALQFQRILGPGLKQKHVEVRMPLSPEISVCFSWINNLRGYVEVGEDTVHESNRMVFGHSHQYFIANSQKLKRRWFRRLPLDPVFVWRYLKHEAMASCQRLRARKHYVRRRRAR
ncbi:MAG: DUF4238 domain-containing protein [Gammaproteobacteria bacterium]